MPTIFSSSSSPPTPAPVSAPVEPVSPTVIPVLPSGLQSMLAVHRQSSNALSSFVVMPTKIRFETQREEEPIILFLRRHPVTNLPWILVSILMLFLPVIVLPFLSGIELVAQLFQISPGLPMILVGLWYLVTLGNILSNFLVWYFTVDIATTERVIDIDFYFLIYKEFSEALLNRIEDVSFVTGGFVASFFDYGDVMVQTAAATERINFDQVPKPREVVTILTELVQSVKR